MTISASDAITRLQTNSSVYTTPEALKALVAQLDITATGNVTILYSGNVSNGISSSSVI